MAARSAAEKPGDGERCKSSTAERSLAEHSQEEIGLRARRPESLGASQEGMWAAMIPVAHERKLRELNPDGKPPTLEQFAYCNLNIIVVYWFLLLLLFWFLVF